MDRLLEHAARMLDHAVRELLRLEQAAPAGTPAVRVAPLRTTADQLRAAARVCRMRQAAADSLTTTPAAGGLVSLGVWAAAAGVPARTARAWAASGRLPGAQKLDSRWRVPVEVEATGPGPAAGTNRRRSS